MGQSTIRPAMPSDCECLSRLRCTYVADRYQGFLAPELLAMNQPSRYLPRLMQVAEQHKLCLDILEMGDRICGYILYGPDQEAEGWGLIVETVCDADAETHQLLIRYALHRLSLMGLPRVHVWTLHDNFRARFLYEHSGFRRDGAQQVTRIGQDEIYRVRYQYCPPA